MSISSWEDLRLHSRLHTWASGGFFLSGDHGHVRPSSTAQLCGPFGLKALWKLQLLDRWNPGAILGNCTCLACLAPHFIAPALELVCSISGPCGWRHPFPMPARAAVELFDVFSGCIFECTHATPAAHQVMRLHGQLVGAWIVLLRDSSNEVLLGLHGLLHPSLASLGLARASLPWMS